MALTHRELMDKLRHLDEITLMELLEISSDDIIERFQDLIDNKRENFEEDLESDYE